MVFGNEIPAATEAGLSNVIELRHDLESDCGAPSTVLSSEGENSVAYSDIVPERAAGCLSPVPGAPAAEYEEDEAPPAPQLSTPVGSAGCLSPVATPEKSTRRKSLQEPQLSTPEGSGACLSPVGTPERPGRKSLAPQISTPEGSAGCLGEVEAEDEGANVSPGSFSQIYSRTEDGADGQMSDSEDESSAPGWPGGYFAPPAGGASTASTAEDGKPVLPDDESLSTGSPAPVPATGSGSTAEGDRPYDDLEGYWRKEWDASLGRVAAGGDTEEERGVQQSDGAEEREVNEKEVAPTTIAEDVARMVADANELSPCYSDVSEESQQGAEAALPDLKEQAAAEEPTPTPAAAEVAAGGENKVDGNALEPLGGNICRDNDGNHYLKIYDIVNGECYSFFWLVLLGSHVTYA